MLSLDDTIAAIASAAGGGGRGIVRLSGPRAAECVSRCFSSADGRLPADAQRPSAFDGEIALASLGRGVPCRLLVWPTARSYTRQAAAEFHTLGSPPLLEALLRSLCAAGARLAEPGEFTLRAFLAGRIDLTQAEAVLGVIDAADGRALEAALSQLAGGLASPLRQLREQLLDLLARLEAGLDFADEDIEFISAAELHELVTSAAAEVAALAARLRERSEGTAAFTAVLVGRPNAGKSSLFNALAGEARAIVSPLPGATRDYLTAELDLAGVAVRLIDTAGADPAAVGLAGEAQRSRDEAIRVAQLELLCLDSSRPWQAWEREQFRNASRCPRLVLRTKCDVDLGVDAISREVEEHSTSAATGAGLDELRAALRAAAVSHAGETDVAALTSARCGESLRLAADCLARAADLCDGQAGQELIAAELRVALHELGKVAGAVYTDDLLDRIFSRFCIGK